MDWTELHDLNLCEEVLVVKPWKILTVVRKEEIHGTK